VKEVEGLEGLIERMIERWRRDWVGFGERGAREGESARVEGLVDRVGWKKQASRDVPVQPSSDIDTYI
jgi:hypothetical protein